MKKLFLACLLLIIPAELYGAAVTSLGATWDTTAGTKTVTATPAIGDLIVIIHGMSDWVSGDDSAPQDNAGGAYFRIGSSTAPVSTAGGTGGALWISVRTTLITSASSTNFQVVNTGDTGGGLSVFKVTGMTRTGSAAIVQTIGESTQTENPPTITFAAATKTDNPIILGVLGEDNPAGLTPPTDFTEVTDTGWDTPTTGIQTSRINSGKTASLYAWIGGAFTDHNEVGIELDASVRYRDCLLLKTCE